MPDGGIVFTKQQRLTRLDAAGKRATFVEVSNAAMGLASIPKGGD